MARTRSAVKQWILFGSILAGILLLAALAMAAWYLTRVVPVGTGFVAKNLCSSTFISKRPPESVYAEDVAPVNPLARVVRWRIDRQTQSVSAHMAGLFKAKAIYRQGCGCTLVRGRSETELRRQIFFKTRPTAGKNTVRAERPWPLGGQGGTSPVIQGVDAIMLQSALDRAFAEPASGKERLTRAVVVVFRGHLIAERYAPGFDADMPLPGWSMSKSVTNAMVGILVKEGWLDPDASAPVDEWRRPDDPRGKITLDQLLRMSDGLAFDEAYTPLDDVTAMLYASADFAAYAAAKPPIHPPDRHWAYSSGSANIVAGIVRRAVATRDHLHYDFFHQTLFDRIGMHSVVMEPDPTGTFVGSSYIWATSRDWARFGLLYLRDGVWRGERILPRGWVAYSVTPTAGASRGQYGALFWLNAGAPSNPSNRLWPAAPADTFAAQGFQEQKLFVIPSKELILVRLGATSDGEDWDDNQFLGDILAAMP